MNIRGPKEGQNIVETLCLQNNAMQMQRKTLGSVHFVSHHILYCSHANLHIGLQPIFHFFILGDMINIVIQG